MKLCTFEVATPVGRFRRLGLVWTGKGILDLNFAFAWKLADQGAPQPQRVADACLPADMLAFLQGGTPAMDVARSTETFARGFDTLPPGLNGETLLYAFDQVKLLAPVVNPPCIRDFYAFEAHVRRSFERHSEPMPGEWYEMPVYHKSGHNHIIGTDADVVWPSFTEKFDYELELAAVIGKEGANITVDNARSYIAGFLVMNDFTARDVEHRERKVRLGPSKGHDWCTAMGPWLVTPDEIVDPYALHMMARINGDLWSDGNSGSIYWTFEQMIAFVSENDRIVPGEILGSGTVPRGCGVELDRWLQPGDVMELEIEKIGVLRNRVMR